jgi:hypothetical protein
MSAPISRRAALIAALGLALAPLAACQSPGGNVTVLQSGTVAVPAGATYAWKPMPAGATTDPRVANDIIQERLTTAIDTALAAKGFRRVADPAAAQLLVSYYVGLENRQETQVSSFGGGPTWCGFRGCAWGFYGPPTVDVDNVHYTEGTLMVDLTDRASGKLAWRSTSQRRVDKSDAAQSELNAIVADMTKSLPTTTAAG